MEQDPTTLAPTTNNTYGLTEDESYPVHILIVDDDEPFGRMLENVITKMTGFACSYVQDPRKALEVLDGSIVDVVITDIKMPDMSGLELTRIIKTKYDADVIVLTGYYEDFSYEEAIENGANDFIEKPLKPTELIIRLKRVLRERAIVYKRKQAEKTLRESEEQYRNVFEDHVAVKLLLDPDTGSIIEANEAAVNYYGWSRERLKQMKIQEINTLPPEDVKKEMEKARIKKQTHFEFRHRRADGSIRDVEVFSSNIKREGKDLLHSIIHDITERKRTEEGLRVSEENFRRSLDESPLGIRIVSKEGETLYVNQTTQNIFGYDSIEEWQTIPAVKRYTKQSYADYEVRRENIPFDKDDSLKYECGIVRKNGEIRNLQVWHKRILWNGERHYQVIYLDITKQKRIEEKFMTSRLQLRALTTRLQQIRKEERTMIAREIHDEMGGGLTGLKMDLSWLLRKMGDVDPCEERVALMDKISTSNALIDQMIHTVRRISTDLRPSVLDDLGLIAALEWQLSEFTSHSGISHELVTAFDYVNLEEATAIAVFRIFQEALTNVARHSRATKVAVLLRKGERSLFGDKSLVLEIRDNGRGITEEEILNPESLGLLGMKERVLAFGGELSVRGEPGGGTTLVLQIPLKQGETS